MSPRWRCSGRTKNGERCIRSVADLSGRCHDHPLDSGPHEFERNEDLDCSVCGEGVAHYNHVKDEKSI